MPDEPTMTETQVKTKTVSKTAMAIAVAFLGISAIAAAAAMTTTTPSGQGAPKCTDTDVSTVNAGNMPLATYQYANINKKGTTTGLGGTNNQPMIGEDKCWNNTRILEYFCNVKQNKVSWNSYNCPTGTNCVNGACAPQYMPCTETDNGIDHLSKGSTKGYILETNTLMDYTDNCVASSTYLNEAYCYAGYVNGVTTTYAKLEEFTYDCANQGMICSDGACVSASSTLIEKGNLIFQSLPLESNVLYNDVNDLSKIALHAFVEDIKIDSVQFTLLLSNSTTIIHDLYLVDAFFNPPQGMILAGPIDLMPSPNIVGAYYVKFDNLNLTLSESANQSTKLVLKGSVSGVFSGSHAQVKVKMAPSTDILGIGLSSASSISPIGGLQTLSWLESY